MTIFSFSIWYDESLQVADGALRCFASLADRFTRRGVDPAPLAKHGLTTELLERLSHCGMPAAALASGAKTSVAASAGTTPDSKGNPNISTVISLLSTLCRGSPGVTHVSCLLFFKDLVIFYFVRDDVRNSSCISVWHRAGLSNFYQPHAAYCQLNLLSGHKSVANHTSLPQWRKDGGKILRFWKLNQNVRIKSF